MRKDLCGVRQMGSVEVLMEGASDKCDARGCTDKPSGAWVWSDSISSDIDILFQCNDCGEEYLNDRDDVYYIGDIDERVNIFGL